MNRLWRGLVSTVVVILAMGLAVALVVVVAERPDRGETLIEVLRIFFAWPAMVALLGFAFGTAFHREISVFLESIAMIRFPGGTELHSRQAPAPSKNKDEAASPPTEGGTLALGSEDQQVIQRHFEHLQQNLAEASQRAELSENETREISKSLEMAGEMIEEERRKAYYWWGQYLNLFLVEKTKLVLQWFADLRIPPTKELFHEYWKPLLPDPKERETIISVLLFHQLLQSNGQQFWITDTGRHFLRVLQDQGLWPHSRFAGGA